MPKAPFPKTPDAEVKPQNQNETQTPEHETNTDEKRNDFDENVYVKNYDNDQGRGYRDDSQKSSMERPANSTNNQ